MRTTIVATCTLLVMGGVLGAATGHVSNSVEPDPVTQVTEAPLPVLVPETTFDGETSEPSVEPSPVDIPVEQGQVEVSVEIEPLPSPEVPEPIVEPEIATSEPEPVMESPVMEDYVPPTPGEEWEGFLVGEVIVCPPGYEVAIDRYPNGVTWASCQ